MKLIAAQISATPGDVEKNLAQHIDAIHAAASQGADAVVFPELSLTGYEPELAGGLAMAPTDSRLDAFQALSDRYTLLIAVGAPTQGREGTQISMIAFQPGLPRVVYSKQLLHADELPFFTPGTQQQVFRQGGHVLVPAICYESLQPAHADQAAAAGAQVYLASVAKSQKGVDLACNHYPAMARKHGMTVIMANCVGPADNFIGAGQSAVWNPNGERVCTADATRQALVAYDTRTGEAGTVSLA
ncbi:carbon-nitrogen hydrolase family protein [Pseudomonas sp. PS01300]|uniref:carbon-nitrogen hydrolase family protein n=1 Tax=Pseudomonas sp. PS01300 TaxID=2991436 RepID=UPI00249CBBFE|nr:carbon-nitrogen hydrolase family protein [Pseudomonas sp. PS01300]